MVSVFDLSRIGIGSSSSHTMGRMAAARRLRCAPPAPARRVTAEVFGSLDGKALTSKARKRAAFDPETDLVFGDETLTPLSSDATRFPAFDAAGAMVLESVFYSIGGGFVVAEGEERATGPQDAPFLFVHGAERLELAHA